MHLPAATASADGRRFHSFLALALLAALCAVTPLMTKSPARPYTFIDPPRQSFRARPRESNFANVLMRMHSKFSVSLMPCSLSAHIRNIKDRPAARPFGSNSSFAFFLATNSFAVLGAALLRAPRFAPAIAFTISFLDSVFRSRCVNKRAPVTSRVRPEKGERCQRNLASLTRPNP